MKGTAAGRPAECGGCAAPGPGVPWKWPGRCSGPCRGWGWGAGLPGAGLRSHRAMCPHFSEPRASTCKWGCRWRDPNRQSCAHHCQSPAAAPRGCPQVSCSAEGSRGWPPGRAGSRGRPFPRTPALGLQSARGPAAARGPPPPPLPVLTLFPPRPSLLKVGPGPPPLALALLPCPPSLSSPAARAPLVWRPLLASASLAPQAWVSAGVACPPTLCLEKALLLW